MAEQPLAIVTGGYRCITPMVTSLSSALAQNYHVMITHRDQSRGVNLAEAIRASGGAITNWHCTVESMSHVMWQVPNKSVELLVFIPSGGLKEGGLTSSMGEYEVLDRRLPKKLTILAIETGALADSATIVLLTSPTAHAAYRADTPIAKDVVREAQRFGEKSVRSLRLPDEVRLLVASSSSLEAIDEPVSVAAGSPLLLESPEIARLRAAIADTNRKSGSVIVL